MSAPMTEVRRVVVRPAPRLDPPYDDEIPSSARTAHLRLLTAPELPFERPDDVAVSADAERLDDLMFGRQPTRRSDLPHPRDVAGRLVQALLEVLAGRRPVHQLRTLTTEDVYAGVQHRAEIAQGTRARRHGSPRTPHAPTRLQSVHVDEPADGVAEVSAVVRHGDRHRAIALRLEGFDGRWRCTVLHML